MNLTDLTEVLRDRAELADSSHEARMSGVRARVSATRRRHAVAAVACVVLALVGIIYATLPRPDRLPEPAVPTRSLPEYQFGTRLIAQAWGDLPTNSVTVRFVPKSLDLLIFTQCDIGQNRALLLTITINDQPFTSGGCGGNTRPQHWDELGVVPGQQSVITLTVEGEQGPFESGAPATLARPDSGTFALGVGEAVPASEYPLPPRPQSLVPLPDHAPEPEVELRSDPANPVARKEVTVNWPGHNVLAQMNAPGRVQVLVNDVVVIDYSHWTYSPGSSVVQPYDWSAYGLHLTAGQPVKITVIPERVTGDWKVTLAGRR